MKENIKNKYGVFISSVILITLVMTIVPTVSASQGPCDVAVVIDADIVKNETWFFYNVTIDCPEVGGYEIKIDNINLDIVEVIPGDLYLPLVGDWGTDTSLWEYWIDGDELDVMCLVLRNYPTGEHVSFTVKAVPTMMGTGSIDVTYAKVSSSNYSGQYDVSIYDEDSVTIYSRYDVNGNGIVNFQDAGLTWVHRDTEYPYDHFYDMDDDFDVDYTDSGIVWANRD